MTGKLIIIEGIDGSGKNTQAVKVTEKLNEMGVKSVQIQFPSYNKTFFGKMAGNYLDGKYGKIDELPPELVAILYAGDRFEKKGEIEDYLRDGYIIICDRYTPSNIAHHGGKISDPVKRKEFIKWLEELEYGVFKIPRPDNVVYLDITPEISQELVMKKAAREYTDKKKDIHEENKDYLYNVYDCYKDLCKDRNWIHISCLDGNSELREVEDITKDILAEIKKIL